MQTKSSINFFSFAKQNISKFKVNDFSKLIVALFLSASLNSSFVLLNAQSEPVSPLEQIIDAKGQSGGQENNEISKDGSPIESSSNEDEDIADPTASLGNFDQAVAVKQIQVIGNQLVPTKVILEQMQTKVGSKFSRRKIAYDLQSLYNLGYFDKDKLMAVPIPVPRGQEGVIIRVQVVENKPITGLVIKGNDLVDNSKIEEFLTPLVGMPRSTNQIRTAVEKVEKVYHDKGYLLASVSELHFDPDGFLIVSVDEGTIDEVVFEGNQRTKPEYLDKITPEALKSGKAYNEETAVKFMEGLKKSGFFKDVKREIKPSPTDPSKHILSFQLEEQRTKSLNMGTGLGTLNGFFGTASFTEPNFRGQGERLDASLQAGTGLLTAVDGDTNGRFVRRPDVRANITYADPFIGNTNMSGSLNLGANQMGSFIVDSAVQRSVRAGGTVYKPLTIKGNDKWGVQGAFSLSQNQIRSFGPNARNTLITAIQNEGKSNVEAVSEADRLRRKQLAEGFYLDLTPSLIYRNIDETGSGWRHNIFAGPSLGVGGAGSYLSSGVDIRRSQRLTEDGWFFKNASHFENQLGDAAAFRNLKAGGPYGMRGYRQFRDVGVGNTMLSNTAEVHIPFTIPKNPIKDTKLVLFNDLGMVFGQSRINDLYGRKSALASVGAGLELNIPFMGPLRVDYGIPLLRPDKKSFWSGRLHINAGSQL